MPGVHPVAASFYTKKFEKGSVAAGGSTTAAAQVIWRCREEESTMPLQLILHHRRGTPIHNHPTAKSSQPCHLGRCTGGQCRMRPAQHPHQACVRQAIVKHHSQKYKMPRCWTELIRVRTRVCDSFCALLCGFCGGNQALVAATQPHAFHPPMPDC